MFIFEFIELMTFFICPSPACSLFLAKVRDDVMSLWINGSIHYPPIMWVHLMKYEDMHQKIIYLWKKV